LRKPKDENEVPDKHDNKGSGSITDQVDNVMMVWRNKRKQFDAQSGEGDPEAPDAMLVCEKQRNGDAEEWYSFWYHQDSQQFLDRQGAMPMDFDAKGDF
jgi:twinkle protein